MKHHILGLDVGGTKIEAALIELSTSKTTCDFEIDHKNERLYGRIIARERVPTERQKGYEHVLGNMKILIDKTLNSANLNIKELLGIGLGIPGTVDPRKQIMLNGNTGILLGKPLATDLQNALGITTPIYLENDATLFALAESWGGAGQLYTKESGISFKNQISIGIILGTGCGGGLVVNGTIIQGKNGGGGEIGHTELITDGNPCYCGKRGCAEQYLAGPAIESLFASRMYSQIEKLPNAAEIFKMAENEEPAAKAVVKQYHKYLARFLANLTNIFDPDFFVFGGGVSKQPSLYCGEVERLMREHIFVPQSAPKLYQHQLGDSAGVIGAALLPFLKQE